MPKSYQPISAWFRLIGQVMSWSAVLTQTNHHLHWPVHKFCTGMTLFDLAYVYVARETLGRGRENQKQAARGDRMMTPQRSKTEWRSPISDHVVGHEFRGAVGGHARHRRSG